MTIYFAKSELSNAIKIGHTDRDVDKRVKEFALPDVEVLATVPGGRKKETDLHERFQHLRIGGSEWFENGQELTEFVGSLQSPGTVGDLWKRAEQLYSEVLSYEKES